MNFETFIQDNLLIIVPIAITSLILKGYTLYLSASKKQVAWFVCLFVFNTLGILPLIYILIQKTKK